MDFQSRAVRNLVDLHERELRAFLVTWQKFIAANAPMPDARGDESYASREHLIGHVLMAARAYMVRSCEWVGRPVTDVDMTTDAAAVAGRFEAFAEEVLAAYRRHLASMSTEEVEEQKHTTRWGALMSVEMLLEHAVVHPMRHGIQLERILAGSPD